MFRSLKFARKFGVIRIHHCAGVKEMEVDESKEATQEYRKKSKGSLSLDDNIV
jgi:hypothetical protein